MNHSGRFIVLVLVGWVGLRALSLGMVPGGEAFAFDRPTPRGSEILASGGAPLPPVVATEFAPVEPIATVAPTLLYDSPAAAYPGFQQVYPIRYGIPVGYAAGSSRGAAVMRYAASPAMPRAWGPADVNSFSLAPAAARYADGVAPLDQWPIAAIAGGRNSPIGRRAQSTPAELIRALPGIDRLSMSAWAMMRSDPGAASLAANGQLGGSQAGSRILWRFDPNLAASIRSSAPIGGVQRTAELAAGLRWQPIRAIPLAVTAERRQSFGRDKGASGFALFAEGGVYDRPIAARFNLDAYLQAGVVGIRDHAMFIDGSATLTRPMWRQLSAGVGVWGGAQPGLARLDAGPRLSWRIGRSMHVHADYRHRFIGHAAPGSGPVLTLAGNF
ncbi:MAG: hypothetical protein M3Q88_05995 [Pseudomonadota bacterium]|nr:hypothetical protein [Pseudomonadota bacterium]